MARLLERLGRRPLGAPVRLVFPEAEDDRVVAAAHRLAGDGAVLPLLLADGGRAAGGHARMGLAPGRVELVDEARAREAYLDEAAWITGLTRGAAARLLGRPAYLAAMMVRAGDADGLVAGATAPTGDVLLACQMLLGEAGGTTSSAFVMELPARDTPLVLADCAANPDPGPGELCDIALAAAALGRAVLEDEPRVALLSFSTHGSAVQPQVDKVIEATRLCHQRAPALLVDGELQADAALSPDIARRKLGDPGPVAGRASVLVFPTLDAGNIGYKLLCALAGATAYGVFLQGFARPAVDLSRGATVDEIAGTSLLLAHLIDASRQVRAAPQSL